MKAIFRNINLLNIGLIIGCVVLLLNLKPMLDYKPVIDVKPDSNLAEHKQYQQLKEGALQNRDIVEYGVIAEKNLFHPERKIVVKTAETQPPPPPPPPEEIPDLILYGTVVSSRLRLAYIEEKNKKRPRPLRQARAKEQEKEGKEQRIFQVGETIGGFTLKEITEDSVILFRDDEKLVVQVFDPSDPKKRTSSTVQKPASSKAERKPIRRPPPRQSPSVTQQIERKKKEQILRRRRLLRR